MTALDPAAVAAWAQGLREAATPGAWHFATAPAEGSSETKAEYVAGCSQPDRADEPLWVAWADNTTGDGFDYLVTAITGDGPTSEANARLIAAAPDLAAAVVALAEQLAAERAKVERVRALAESLLARLPDGTGNGRAINSYRAAWMILAALDGTEQGADQ